MIWALLSVLSLSLLVYPTTAAALMGGEKASGDPKVVALIHWNESQRQGCSGALIAPRIVLTAAHCMSRMPKDGIWRPAFDSHLPVSGPLSEKTPMWVALPGTEVHSYGTQTARVIAQYGPDYYEDSFYDKNGQNSHGSLYDFAVLVLDKPLSSQIFRVSTMQETLDLIGTGAEVLALGYGYSNYNMYSSPSPMKSKTFVRKQFIWQGAEERGILQTKLYYKLGMIVQTDFPDNVYHGGGDSGSPLWANISGEWVYVGALSAAVGPTANLTKDDPMWNGKFWLENAGGQYYSAWSFQYLIDDADKFLEQQIMMEVRAAAELKAKRDTEAKAALELNAKEEADAKAIADKLAATKAVSLKKTTITCVKGKLVKKATAFKPVCPKGYKNK
jgi:hypothetical protein